nr:FG-GAP repeat protein [Pseudomonas oleovorans]
MPLYRTLAGLLLLPTQALADLPRFEPEPGLHAQIQQQGERYFLQQPDGSRFELSIPEGNEVDAPSFEVGDYDLDGHPDLAIRVPVGMVNSAYNVYLYRPALQRFEQLKMAPALLERANCSWLSELQPNNEERALYSHCRSGPRWYYYAYRFDASGTPWLYKTLQVRNDYDPDAPVFFPVFEKTLDPQGKVIASRALDDNDQAQTWAVPASRLYLHTRPDDASRSKAYLIEGDVCEVLEQQGNWLLIRYASRKGPLERWVSLDEAYGQTRP